ncbi:helix-turn-helix domain-containing protein [Streptomyces sp. NPDC012888]|uniref:helix-turn-helix domain-containing protein n=1 Tax=Streptomyces sp. NPDC012888 TaxID=3364855 RepID=UPI0036C87D84
MTATATECRQLAAEMRQLREATGLSLAALGRRTPYSKSSWERYLNGKQPPPRPAVEALCAVAGEHPARLLALWELADAAWSGRARPAPAGADGAREAATAPAPPDPPVRAAARRRRAAPAAVILCAGGLAAAVALVLLPGSGPRSQAAAEPERPVRNPGCAAAACAGEDPLRMGCGGEGMVATVLTGKAPGGRELELRYGEYCRAVWVRASGLGAGDRVDLSVPDSPVPQVRRVTGQDAGQYVATPMAPAAGGPAGARFCLTPGDTGESGRVCFG